MHFKKVIHPLRALPKIFSSRHKANEKEGGATGGQYRESRGALSGSSHSAHAGHPVASEPGRHAVEHQTSAPAQADASLEMLIAAVFALTGYRMNEQQAEELRTSLAGFAPREAPNPETDAQRGNEPLEKGPTPVPPGSASPALRRDEKAARSPGAELMRRARELERGLSNQNLGLSEADVAELLSLVRRLGQIFFEQSRDKVTHQQLQAEIANLKRLIETKGK